MSKEAIKNLLMDFMADYDPNKWSNDDVYEKYAEKIDNVRSMGEIIAFTELTKKVKDLEHRLANCIEPKFKVGDEVYWVFDGSVEYMKIYCISRFKDHKDLVFYGDGYGVFWSEKELFATKEEAKAKLEEMKNGIN